jgi:hypothetical protein
MERYMLETRTGAWFGPFLSITTVKEQAHTIYPGCTFNHIHHSGGFVVVLNEQAVADILPQD